MRDAIALVGLLAEPNVRAFLRMVRVGEGTADDDGYRRLFGGELVDGFADHPRRAVTRTFAGRPITSTAAGAYQFLSRTWDECERALGLGDFSPANQDIAALYLIERRHALEDVLAGRVESAIAKCNREWASLPGSPYGQPTRTIAQALAVYTAAGGSQLPAPQPTADRPPAVDPARPPVDPSASKESSVNASAIPAFIGAALESLFPVVPALIRVFGDSPQAEKNAKAAELVVNAAKQATGARNEQELIEMVKADPAAAQAAKVAIESRWLELTEAGSGGLDAARKADAAIMLADGPWWNFLRSPSFWALLLLVPLVYMLVGSLIGLWGTASWSDDVRAGLAGSIISAIIGGAVGYYWGQTTSRNRAAAS